MSRAVLYLVIIVGIGYGGFSLLSGDEEKDERDVGLTAVAPKPNPGPGGGSGSGPETPEKTTDVAAAVAEANEASEKARSAGSRAEAVALKDLARRKYNEALIAAPAGEMGQKLRRAVESLNDEVLFSDEAIDGKSFLYTFQPTDRLWTLCVKGFPGGRKTSVSPGFVLWMNGISDARSIQAGQILKVPTEELSLFVVKSRYELWVLLGGVYLRSYPVGLGRDDKTPEGIFIIETKKENPDWYRGGRRIPYGSPDNQLGTRWMGFKRTPRATGYGIHGTDNPDTIGKNVSEGCVRMRNADVEELFRWVREGTRVKVVR